MYQNFSETTNRKAVINNKSLTKGIICMNNFENRTGDNLGAPTDGPNSDSDQREQQAATLYNGQNAPISTDSEIQEMAESIANNPTLIKKRIDAVNRLGVVGERKAIAMNYAALDSRLLLEDRSGSNALAIKIAGHYGAGKSHTLTKCLELYPASEYHLMSAGSAKSLYYLDGGLKHKALIATEAFQFQSKKGADDILWNRYEKRNKDMPWVF